MGEPYDAVLSAIAEAKKHPTTAILRQIAQEKQMTDLLARLEAATEGSAELDAAVLRAAGWSKRDDAPQWSDQWGNWRDMKHPTRSLDAITGLIEARGWRVVFVTAHFDPDTYFVIVRRPEGPRHFGEHADWRLALCIAFIRALETAA